MGTPRRPHGPSGAPSGLDGRPAARRRHRPADFHRRPPVWAARSSYRRRPGLCKPNVYSGWNCTLMTAVQLARQTHTIRGHDFLLRKQSPPPNQSPSKGDLRRTPLLRSPLDPLEGRRAAVGARRGPGGPVGTPWRAQGVRTSILHQYGTVGRPVGRLNAPSCVERHTFFFGEN